MINIVIPMAGAGSRFAQAGYDRPKPFIDVCGMMMIERVLDNLSLHKCSFILIARADHVATEQEAFKKLQARKNVHLLTTNKLTEGAACTILHSIRWINNETPLLLANSDQIVETDLSQFIQDSEARRLDGSLLTFHADHPKWSYAKVDEQGYLTEVREKQVISEHATVGLYYFRRGKHFVNSAVEMIANNDRVNNEFYTAPAYNYALRAKLKIGIYDIPGSAMFGLGTPEDLEVYQQHLASAQVAA